MEVWTMWVWSCSCFISFIVYLKGQLTLAVYFEDEKGVDQAFELCQSVGPYVASSFGEVQMKSVFRR